MYLPATTVPSHGRVAAYEADAEPELGGPSLSSLSPLGSWGLPAGRMEEATLALPREGKLVAARVLVCTFTLAEAVPALLRLRSERQPEYRRPPDSVRAWALAARLGAQLAEAGQLLPGLKLDEQGRAHGVWSASSTGEDALRRTRDWLAAALPFSAVCVLREDGRMWEPVDVVQAFLDGVVDLAVRAAAEPRRPGRPRARVLPWTARWTEALVDPEDTVVPLRDDAADLSAAVTGWQHAGASDARNGLTELHLHAPEDATGSWLLELGVRAADGTYMPAEQAWRERDEIAEVLLTGLGRAARIFPPLDATLRQTAPVRAELDLDEAWQFVSQAAGVLESAGLVIRLPDVLSELGLRARLRLGLPDDPQATGADAVSAAESTVGARWEVALGEDPLDEAELEELVAAQSPLVRWRGHWVRVDPELVEQMRHLPAAGTLPMVEALGLGLAGETTMAPIEQVRQPTADVVVDGALADLLSLLTDTTAQPPPLEGDPAGFVGTLRPYQRRGVAWLHAMGSLRLGAVLADDMGLGKTGQLIAYLLQRGGEGPHLVVCPTAVLGNWAREVRRFAPELPVGVHHGEQRLDAEVAPAGVVITTYGTLRRDVEELARIRWDVLALDEAQQVKNPTTLGAHAVRRLEAVHRLALTGTPLENRLAELWALLDALNPGLLGSRAGFTRRYVRPIEQRRDPRASERLRRVVAPFLLRREKTDPAVINDLPEKIERTVICPLTPEQAQLYERAVGEALGEDGSVRGETGMRRRGRVLALLTRLKQICNHPAQGVEGDRGPLRGRSGKLEVTRQIVRDATAGGDQLLVFSQFVVMARLLAEELSDELGVDIPVLHGQLTASARDRIVDRFQGGTADAPPPVLVVSLRAGGTGLNLTAATHVVHYDRWWNPAVEDQATDRTHRIGQLHTVEVHKLVTAGTLEERIDALLERKRWLAAAVVGASESWVSELDDEELAELVALSTSAEVATLDDEDDDLKEAS
ncbi:MAG: SNF2-related protein [Egibacteraceae bacterium]